MKKSFLTTCVALFFLTATAQENPYIVKTRGVKKKAQGKAPVLLLFTLRECDY